jgi:hypothetical protein
MLWAESDNDVSMKLTKGIIKLPNHKRVSCSNSSLVKRPPAVQQGRRFKPRLGHVCLGMRYLRKDEDDLGQVSTKYQYFCYVQNYMFQVTDGEAVAEQRCTTTQGRKRQHSTPHGFHQG